MFLEMRPQSNFFLRNTTRKEAVPQSKILVDNTEAAGVLNLSLPASVACGGILLPLKPEICSSTGDPSAVDSNNIDPLVRRSHQCIIPHK